MEKVSSKVTGNDSLAMILQYVEMEFSIILSQDAEFL